MIFLAIYIILAFLSYFDGKSKVLFFLLYGLLFIITVHIQFGNDINNIRESYEAGIITADGEERSALFTLLVYFFGQAGVPFYAFRVFQFLFWSIPITLFVRKFSLYPAIVFACCFFLPLSGFGCQIRNGLMTGILYWGFYALFSMKGRWGKVLFAFSVVVAGTMHYLAFVYFIVLLSFLPIRTQKLKSLSIIICVIEIILIKSGQLLGFVASNIGDYYVNNHLSNFGEINLTFVILAGGLIINCILSQQYSTHIHISEDYYDDRHVFFAKLVPRINYLLLALLPLLLLSGSFYRIFQNVFILTAILAFNAARVPRAGKLPAKIEYLIFYLLVAAYYLRWQGEFFSAIRSIVL